ncbi:hypothetical protein GJAV_G00005560 [Gymnothorax javanicus]|nr:hypothetical protein GJAV_G00005560 [Gymnothorax javanicus]
MAQRTLSETKNPFKEELDMGDTSSSTSSRNCGTSSIGASPTMTSFLFHPSWKGIIRGHPTDTKGVE